MWHPLAALIAKFNPNHDERGRFARSSSPMAMSASSVLLGAPNGKGLKSTAIHGATVAEEEYIREVIKTYIPQAHRRILAERGVEFHVRQDCKNDGFDKDEAAGSYEHRRIGLYRNQEGLSASVIVHEIGHALDFALSETDSGITSILHSRMLGGPKGAVERFNKRKAISENLRSAQTRVREMYAGRPNARLAYGLKSPVEALAEAYRIRYAPITEKYVTMRLNRDVLDAAYRVWKYELGPLWTLPRKSAYRNHGNASYFTKADFGSAHEWCATCAAEHAAVHPLAKMADNQPRVPKGSGETSGQWMGTRGGSVTIRARTSTSRGSEQLDLSRIDPDHLYPAGVVPRAWASGRPAVAGARMVASSAASLLRAEERMARIAERKLNRQGYLMERGTEDMGAVSAPKTPEWQSWFAGSIARGRDGVPLLIAHGGTGNFAKPWSARERSAFVDRQVAAGKGRGTQIDQQIGTHYAFGVESANAFASRNEGHVTVGYAQIKKIHVVPNLPTIRTDYNKVPQHDARVADYDAVHIDAARHVFAAQPRESARSLWVSLAARNGESRDSASKDFDNLWTTKGPDLSEMASRFNQWHPRLNGVMAGLYRKALTRQGYDALIYRNTANTEAPGPSKLALIMWRNGQFKSAYNTRPNRRKRDIAKFDILHPLVSAWEVIQKYNPNHDPKTGRFVTGRGIAAALPKEKGKPFAPKPGSALVPYDVDNTRRDSVREIIATSKITGATHAATALAIGGRLKKAHKLSAPPSSIAHAVLRGGVNISEVEDAAYVVRMEWRKKQPYQISKVPWKGSKTPMYGRAVSAKHNAAALAGYAKKVGASKEVAARHIAEEILRATYDYGHVDSAKGRAERAKVVADAVLDGTYPPKIVAKAVARASERYAAPRIEVTRPTTLSRDAVNKPLPYEDADFNMKSGTSGLIKRLNARLYRELELKMHGLEGLPENVTGATSAYIDSPRSTRPNQYDIIDKAIAGAKLPRDVVMYRGLSMARSSVIGGAKLVHSNVTSVTHNKRTAQSFADGGVYDVPDGRVGVIVRFIAKKGTPALAMNADEHEFLLPRGTVFTLKKQVRHYPEGARGMKKDTDLYIWTAEMTIRKGVRRKANLKQKPVRKASSDPAHWLTPFTIELPDGTSDLADEGEPLHTSREDAIAERRNRKHRGIVTL